MGPGAEGGAGFHALAPAPAPILALAPAMGLATAAVVARPLLL